MKLRNYFLTGLMLLLAACGSDSDNSNLTDPFGNPFINGVGGASNFTQVVEQITAQGCGNFGAGGGGGYVMGLFRSNLNTSDPNNVGGSFQAILPNQRTLNVTSVSIGVNVWNEVLVVKRLGDGVSVSGWEIEVHLCPDGGLVYSNSGFTQLHADYINVDRTNNCTIGSIDGASVTAITNTPGFPVYLQFAAPSQGLCQPTNQVF